MWVIVSAKGIEKFTKAPTINPGKPTQGFFSEKKDW